MSSDGMRFRFETMQEIIHEEITSTYAPVGDGFANAVRLVYLLNNTDQILNVSMKTRGVVPVETGEDDHLVLPAGSFFLADIMSNKTHTKSGFIEVGTVFWVEDRGTTPTTGSFIVSALYGE